jgi:hypothetical protein
LSRSAAATTTLKLTRIFKAPLDRVYAAWTDPAQRKQWSSPKPGSKLPLILIASINSSGLGMLPIGSVGIIIGIAKDVEAPAYDSQAPPKEKS